jgi:streptomycin 6-kinase
MITKALARNVVAVWGDDGARWLADLPTIVDDVIRAWDLSLGESFEM